MLRRHPILTVFLSTILLLVGYSWWALSDGVVVLPGGTAVDFSMALQVLSGGEVAPLAEADLKDRMQLPEGFDIEIWATGIPNARLMAVTDTGDLLVSSPREGKVFLLARGADGTATGADVLLEGLDRPHGLALHDGWLYIGEGAGVSRVRFAAAERATSGAPEKIVTGLAEGGNHWSKTVHIGPDNRLYVSLGSSCNVCEETETRAAMLRYELDGSNGITYATGLRNAVDFAWQPQTGVLYATDNGRDLMGDDDPPCELNEVIEGGFYGWPYVNGAGHPDPDFGGMAPDKAASAIAPTHEFPAHTAPLGIAFYDAEAFPQRYRGAAFVALHGSWNRSSKAGFEVVAVHFQADGSTFQEPFLTGFEVDEQVSGRPVGVAVGPAGELFVSDDYTGSIYRIVHGELATSSAALMATTSQTPETVNLTPAERERALASGEVLWTQNGCAACHVDGEADAPPRILVELDARYDAASLSQFLLVPQPPMPLYPFSDNERTALAVYLLAEFSEAE